MFGKLAVTVLAAALSQSGQSAEDWQRLPLPEHFTDLRYPHEALEARLVGVVVLHVRTDADGRVVSAETLTGPALLAQPSIANVRTWKWPAGVRNAAVVYRFDIDFGMCRDDHQSLFRMVHANLVVVTACSAPGRPGPSYSIGHDNYRFGGKPEYPKLAHSARIAGVVVLRLGSDRTGRLIVEPLTQLPFLTAAAVAHASQWRVQGPAPNPKIAVYEFGLDNHACGESGSELAFWTVVPGYVKLSGCEPSF